MSDSLLWLHANYILPQLKAAPLDDYSFHFDYVKNELPPSVQGSLDRCLEFTAIRAFLLGVRTGMGLAPFTPR